MALRPLSDMSRSWPRVRVLRSGPRVRVPRSGPREPAGFDAFVSYSHRPDQALAEALRLGLHQLARPWYRLRALRVFQDVASMSANPALWPAIEQALARSRHLVLLASPEAAASKWVRKEIEYWRANKPVDTLLLAVTRGDCFWDEEAGDFDWARSDAVPRALEGAFTHEPFVVDLRGLEGPEQLSLRDAGFAVAVAKLAARFRDVDVDAVFGEDRAQQRKRVRVIWATVVVLALLAVTASVAAVVANRNANTAEERLKDVSSRQLAAQALELKSGSMDTALLLAAQAWRTSPTPAARNGLLSVVQEAEQGLDWYPRLPTGVAAPFSLDTLALSHDGRWMFAARCPCGDLSAGSVAETREGRLFVWSTEHKERPARVLDPHDDTGYLETLLPGADGRFVLSLSGSGQIRLWDTRTRAIRDLAPAHESAWITSVADGRYFAAVPEPGRIIFLDALTGRRTAEVRGDLLRVSGDSLRGQVLAGTDTRGRLVMWDVRTGRAVGAGPSLGAGPEEIPAVAVSGDGRRLAVVVGADRARAMVLDARDASVVATVRPKGGGALAQVALRPDGEEVALVDERGRLTTTAVPGGAGHLGLRVALAAGAEVIRLVYSPSGRLLSVTTSDGSDQGTLKYVVAASDGTARAVLRTRWGQFAAGEKVILGWRDNRVEVGDLTTGLPLRVESNAVSAVVPSPDSRLVAIAEFDRVRLWDLTDPAKPPIDLPGVPESVHGLAFTGDGARLVGVGATGRAVVWDVGRALRHHLRAELPIDPNRMTAYDVSGDGRNVVTVTLADGVQVRDLTTGRVRRTVRVPFVTRQPYGVTVSADGGHALLRGADGDGESTALIRMSDGRRLRDLPGSVGFSGDGTRVISLVARPDGTRTATAYDTARAAGPARSAFAVRGFSHGDTVSFTLDRTGERLAVTDAVGRTVVHEVDTGRRVMLCEKQMGPSAGGSRGIAFAPRGTTVAVSSQDAATRLLAPGDDGGCRVLATVPGSGHTVLFSPDGSLLFTEGDMRLRDARTLEVVGEQLFDDASPLTADVFFSGTGQLMKVSYDGTLRGLELRPAELTRRACALAGRDLTREEWSRFGVLGAYRAGCGTDG